MHTNRRMLPLLLTLSFTAACADELDDLGSVTSALATEPGDPLPTGAAHDLFVIEGSGRWASRCVSTAGLSACGEDADEHYVVTEDELGHYSFANVATGLCLDVLDGSGDDGAPTVETPCDGRPSQRWRSVQMTARTYRLVNVNSEKCLDIDLRDDRHTVQQWTCHGDTNQAWIVHPAQTMEIRPTMRAVTGRAARCLDVSGASTLDGAAVQQWACHGGPNQAFFVLRDPDDGSLELRALHSGKCLGVEAAGDVNGTRLVQVPCTGAPEQRFTLGSTGLVDRIGEARYPLSTVRPRHLPKCIDRDGGVNADNGRPIQLWACHGGSNQSFVFVPGPAR